MGREEPSGPGWGEHTSRRESVKNTASAASVVELACITGDAFGHECRRASPKHEHYTGLRIDVYPHIRPPKYREALHNKTRVTPITERFGLPIMETTHDVNARLPLIDAFGDYCQTLNFTIPPWKSSMQAD